MPLPTPKGRQREVLCLPPAGHFVVLGTAGSGKSTLAILRAAYLSDRSTDHHGKTLLVTFNRALVAYLRYLQDLRLKDVVVENFHTFARGYLASRSKMPYAGILGDVDERLRLIQKAIQQVRQCYEASLFFDRPIEFFSEEIKWISQHGLKTCDMYRDAERLGRGTARVDRRLRAVAFEIYEAYRQLRSAMNKLYDWDDLATEVCQEFDADHSARRYRHVIIDEGQDFSPEMVRALGKAISKDGCLTLFGDMAQQIIRSTYVLAIGRVKREEGMGTQRQLPQHETSCQTSSGNCQDAVLRWRGGLG